jgi:antitoxin component YwqK of YwqJK toxin-antitoxin module
MKKTLFIALCFTCFCSLAQRIETYMLECSTLTPSRLSDDGKTVRILGEKEPFTGIYQQLYCDSTVRDQIPYVKGVKHGKVTSFYKRSGAVMRETEYVNGVKISAKEYYDDGGIKTEGYFDKKGQPHGEFKEYDYNGKVLSAHKFENGKRLN